MYSSRKKIRIAIVSTLILFATSVMVSIITWASRDVQTEQAYEFAFWVVFAIFVFRMVVSLATTIWEELE